MPSERVDAVRRAAPGLPGVGRGFRLSIFPEAATTKTEWRPVPPTKTSVVPAQLLSRAVVNGSAFGCELPRLWAQIHRPRMPDRFWLQTPLVPLCTAATQHWRTCTRTPRPNSSAACSVITKGTCRSGLGHGNRNSFQPGDKFIAYTSG